MKSRAVLKHHAASYADPIAVAKGDLLTLTGREDFWDGHRWLWAVAVDGGEGWVPDDLVTDTGEGPVASRDYSANELTCSVGEVVGFIRETHGWAWCRKDDGSEGWLPLKILSKR